MKITVPNLTGKQWIKRLEDKGYKISEYAKYILTSPDFKSNPGEHKVEIIKSTDVKECPTTREIREYANKKALYVPSPDLACAIRESVSDEDIKDMGLWYIITMHEPIKDSDGDPGLLLAGRGDDGRWLDAYWGKPDGGWGRDFGFAFVLSQVGTKDLVSKPSSDTKSLELRVEKLEAWIESYTKGQQELSKRLISLD